jgi:hypothetical protein
MDDGIKFVEQDILSFLIKYPNNSYLLNEEDFISKSAKAIFKSIVIIGDNKSKPDINSRNLSIEINKTFPIDQKIITELFEEKTNKDFDFLIDSLKLFKVQVNIKRNILDNLQDEIHRKGLRLDKIIDIRDCLIEEIDKLTYTKNNLFTNRTWMDLYEENLKLRSKNKFYSSGDGYLDKCLSNGLEPGYFSILAGQSGVGKVVLLFI